MPQMPQVTYTNCISQKLTCLAGEETKIRDSHPDLRDDHDLQASETSVEELDICFQCKRTDVKLMDFGGFKGCRPCMVLTTKRTEVALEKYSSERSALSSVGTAFSAPYSESQANLDDSESDSDIEDGEAAKVLATLTFSANSMENQEESVTDDYRDGSDGEGSVSNDGEELAEEVEETSIAESFGSIPSSDSQQFLNTISKRPNEFEAITCFQESTVFSIYQPFDFVQSQGYSAVIDTKFWKFYTCPLVMNTSALCRISLTYGSGEPRP